MFSGFSANQDIMLYLICVQILPAIYLYKSDSLDKHNNNLSVVTWLTATVLIFWLVWGGYSADSWRYLSGFDNSPVVWNKEKLFWSVGFIFGKLLPDPWPLKLLSCLVTSILFFSFYTACRNKKISKYYYVLAIFTVLVLPGYYLLTGNAIKQGFGAAVVILGISIYYSDRRWIGLTILAMAPFFHLTSIIFAISFYLKRFNGLFLILLLVSPFISFLVLEVSRYFGYDLSSHVKYSGLKEGVFHYQKFIASNIIAYGLLWTYRKSRSREQLIFISSYIWITIISNLLLAYEVPFERILLYVNYILPLVLVEILQLPLVQKVKRSQYFKPILISSIIAFGSVVWSHNSTLISLGYA